MEEIITDIYKEIREFQNDMRMKDSDEYHTLNFLDHLMKEIEEKIFYPNHVGDVEEDEPITFTGDELNELIEYKKELGTDTVQKAIMNAVRNAMDNVH